jgi:hypothetical protein
MKILKLLIIIIAAQASFAAGAPALLFGDPQVSAESPAEEYLKFEKDVNKQIKDLKIAVGVALGELDTAASRFSYVLVPEEVRSAHAILDKINKAMPRLEATLTQFFKISKRI